MTQAVQEQQSVQTPSVFDERAYCYSTQQPASVKIHFSAPPAPPALLFAHRGLIVTNEGADLWLQGDGGLVNAAIEQISQINDNKTRIERITHHPIEPCNALVVEESLTTTTAQMHESMFFLFAAPSFRSIRRQEKMHCSPSLTSLTIQLCRQMVICDWNAAPKDLFFLRYLFELGAMENMIVLGLLPGHNKITTCCDLADLPALTSKSRGLATIQSRLVYDADSIEQGLAIGVWYSPTCLALPLANQIALVQLCHAY